MVVACMRRVGQPAATYAEDNNTLQLWRAVVRLTMVMACMTRMNQPSAWPRNVSVSLPTELDTIRAAEMASASSMLANSCVVFSSSTASHTRYVRKTPVICGRRDVKFGSERANNGWERWLAWIPSESNLIAAFDMHLRRDMRRICHEMHQIGLCVHGCSFKLRVLFRHLCLCKLQA